MPRCLRGRQGGATTSRPWLYRNKAKNSSRSSLEKLIVEFRQRMPRHRARDRIAAGRGAPDGERVLNMGPLASIHGGGYPVFPSATRTGLAPGKTGLLEVELGLGEVIPRPAEFMLAMSLTHWLILHGRYNTAWRSSPRCELVPESTISAGGRKRRFIRRRTFFRTDVITQGAVHSLVALAGMAMVLGPLPMLRDRRSVVSHLKWRSVRPGSL